jgi:hypothetical protein
MRQFFVALLLFVLAPPALANNDAYKVETIGELKEAAVAEAVRAALNPKGLRIVDAKGKAAAEIWLAKSIQGDNKHEVPGALFARIPEGSFIGVVNFPSNTSDYRGQGIKAGYYTFRFGFILQDGNHLGVSPARDFFLICPIGQDKDPKAQLKQDELIKLSRAASGTGHPGVWSLVYPTTETDLPRVITNEHEHVILETKLSTTSGEITVGLIVVGQTEG